MPQSGNCTHFVGARTRLRLALPLRLLDRRTKGDCVGHLQPLQHGLPQPLAGFLGDDVLDKDDLRIARRCLLPQLHHQHPENDSVHCEPRMHDITDYSYMGARVAGPDVASNMHLGSDRCRLCAVTVAGAGGKGGEFAGGRVVVSGASRFSRFCGYVTPYGETLLKKIHLIHPSWCAASTQLPPVIDSMPACWQLSSSVQSSGSAMAIR